MKSEIPVGDEQLPDYSTWNNEEMLEALTDLFEGEFRGFTEHKFGSNVEALDRRASLELFITAMVNDGDVLASTYASRTIPLVPFADASWKEILEETDWAELRTQKGKLSEILMEYHKKGMKKKSDEKNIKRFSAIEGILSLLDHIQDAAANEIGEEKVFDHRCECGEQLKNFVIPDQTGKGLTETFGCPKCDS
jgi:hypothetical protein